MTSRGLLEKASYTEIPYNVNEQKALFDWSEHLVLLIVKERREVDWQGSVGFATW